MEHKGTFGKGLGIGSSIAIIIAIVCQLFDTGVVPWIEILTVSFTLLKLEQKLKNWKENLKFWVKMPELLKKIVEFFKNNQSAKDLLIGSIGAVIGAVFLDFTKKRLQKNWLNI